MTDDRFTETIPCLEVTDGNSVAAITKIAKHIGTDRSGDTSDAAVRYGKLHNAIVVTSEGVHYSALIL
jgi:hypothetical protein